MTRTSLYGRLCVFALCILGLAGCGPSVTPNNLSYSLGVSDPLAGYALSGDTHLVLDPSIMRQGLTYHLFSTGMAGTAESGRLPIRCSEDQIAWRPCGFVFVATPAWVVAKVPGIASLWAPDVSFFRGLYHVYYAGSTSGSQQSVIGLATNTTLDAADPAYRWVDRGEILESKAGDDFNAIDPNAFVDLDNKVYLTYGSYWTGIKQRELDPATGQLLPDASRYDLAGRPEVRNHPIEGPSLVRHGGFYYLFVSIDYCCNADAATNNYKQAVGRSPSPHGPFVDMNGTLMTTGGGTVLLEGDSQWYAPGGGTAHLDAETGESMMVFHAHRTSENGTPYVWLKHLVWVNDWPSFV